MVAAGDPLEGEIDFLEALRGGGAGQGDQRGGERGEANEHLVLPFVPRRLARSSPLG